MVKDIVMIHKKRVTMKGDRQVPVWTYREDDVIGVAEFLIVNKFTLSDVVKVESIKTIYDNSVQPPKKYDTTDDLTDKFWDYVNDRSGEKKLPTIKIVDGEVVTE